MNKSTGPLTLNKQRKVGIERELERILDRSYSVIVTTAEKSQDGSKMKRPCIKELRYIRLHCVG